MSNSLASIGSGWQLKLTGWPWWAVLLLAIAGVWALVRLYRKEMAALAPKIRQRLLLLRGAALALLILFLMEPSLTRRTTERVLPLAAIVIDQSGSMAVKDESMAPGAKLAEAIGLKLLPASVRPLKTNVVEQAASDQAILAGAKEGATLVKSLASLSELSRYERAVKLAQQTVIPTLQKNARVKTFAMDTGLAPLDLSKPAKLLPNRATDFEASLAALARNWAQEYVGGIVLLTDGRQTTGADPTPVIRSLRARGALLSGIMLGDPAAPPDAVVAEVSGSSEVFLGEPVPLSVRYRITGADEMDWDMVLTREGKELERRTVRGNGLWQYETFAFAATNAGINLYLARLELSREQSADWPLRPPGSVTMEFWNNVGGERVADLVENPAFPKAPSGTTTLDRLEYSDRGQQYGTRIRGFVVPPQSGNYIFWISSDDSSELWLSRSENPNDKVKVAFVAGYVQRGKWDGQPSQKSQPITLKARRPYYFETLHKQGGGEDFLSVGWQLPDGAMERPIPSSRLAGYDEKTAASLAQRKVELLQAKTNQWKEASLANNSAECSVVVNQDPIKVLLVDSTPRWESRYLAAMFERDRRVIFTRRYHSVIVQDQNQPLLPKTQAEWDGYDMICLGDLDGNELPPEQQNYLVNFVARRGGFLVCLAGPRGLPRAFSLGSLAGLLPVRVSLQPGKDSEPVTVALTTQGVDHPIMQILNDPGYNQKLWPLLPPLQWTADFVVAKPGATVLLSAQNPTKTPIVAVQRYGAGRVFWMGTEESWRWRDRLGERVHQTFWLQAMRWGLAGRLRGKDPRLQVGLDRYLMSPADAAELKARVATGRGDPITEPPVVKLGKIDDNGEVIAGSERTLEMLPMAEAPGIWRLSVQGLDEGLWRVTTSHRASELQGLAESRDLIVRSQNGVEGLDLSGDLPGLTRMANVGGHQAGTADQAEALMKDLASKLKPRNQERRETIRLWNSYASMALVMVLLCTEWVLRKRYGLP
ncbi:MAG: PA14 domain-containing protein [Limisphaerales bacterium]